MARPEERASNLVSLRRDTRSYWWPSSEPVRPEVRPASTAARRGVRRCVRTAVGPTRPERQPLCGVWPADDSRQFDGGRRSVQRIEWSGAQRRNTHWIGSATNSARDSRGIALSSFYTVSRKLCVFELIAARAQKFVLK